MCVPQSVSYVSYFSHAEKRKKSRADGHDRWRQQPTLLFRLKGHLNLNELVTSDVECYQVADLASLERQKHTADSPWHRGIRCCSALPPCAMHCGHRESRPCFSQNTFYKEPARITQCRQIGNLATAEDKPRVWNLYSLLLTTTLVFQFQ